MFELNSARSLFKTSRSEAPRCGWWDSKATSTNSSTPLNLISPTMAPHPSTHTSKPSSSTSLPSPWRCQFRYLGHRPMAWPPIPPHCSYLSFSALG
ncbi:hypothetical protein V6N13_106898 [Hibiscus sabdariffa]|uniref:Uncharacterized protein n=1 Tax=Hibiscus sabdariffa TaxID=183260 RepID=A0ABR2F247_9ROSI